MKVASVLSLAFAIDVLAQFPPQPVGVVTVNSERTPGVSISYKETHICETTKGVRAYSGYVNLPSSVLQLDYNISTFFWYFQARKNPEHAPTIIYLAGGVGESSLFGVTAMGGPCYIDAGANTTSLNPWSFNNEANVVYVDQPSQTGFSYDVLVNGTLDQISGTYTPSDFSSGIPTQNATFLVGTIPSQLPNQTSNNSMQAGIALWHFTQAFNEFPEYNTSNSKISLWANSWGGFYAPAALAYFEEQNEKRYDNCNTSFIDVDTLGLLNACVDEQYEMPHYLRYEINNTYDFNPYNESNPYYQQQLANLTRDGGCLSQIAQCRAIAEQEDPLFIGNNAEVNGNCSQAFEYCLQYTMGGNAFGDRSTFDIAHVMPEAYPYTYISTFFNQAWVQLELGVPLNFSAFSNAATAAFVATGDAARGNKSHIEYLLSRGKKVVMVYGDRDYRCNWLGAENISLELNFPAQERFVESGYAELLTNESYVGGVTRQAGNLAFNRIFQAGHFPHGSQPETVYRILERSLKDLDIATGKVDVGEGCDYQTQGPLDSWSWNYQVLPASPPIACTTWDFGVTCTEDQMEALINGTAVLDHDVVISPAA